MGGSDGNRRWTSKFESDFVVSLGTGLQSCLKTMSYKHDVRGNIQKYSPDLKFCE